MCRRLRLQKKLREAALEYWLFGGSWIFHEWNEEEKVWESITILNQDTLDVESYPYTDYTKVGIRPSGEDQLIIQEAQANPENEALQEALEGIPQDILDRIENGQNIPLDTDPYEGSFVYHFIRRVLAGDSAGISILERVLDALLYRDKLRQTQSMIASRSMTPKNIVWADGLSDSDVSELREQVDLAIADPDFSIVANYQITWEQIGAEGRLLDMATEYDYTETLLTVGLGVTRELLTGEGTFSGNRMGLEVMNTSYMCFRDDISEYVEECMFRPVAVANDFYEEDDKGNRTYIYPRLTFTRLALRDNVDTFDMLFNLYQKGSIDISVILDLLNIDPADTKDRLERDMFTVNDSAYNDLLRGIYQGVGEQVVARTDIVARITKYLGLTLQAAAAPDAGGGLGGGGFGAPPMPPGGDMGGMPPGGDMSAMPPGGDMSAMPPAGAPPPVGAPPAGPGAAPAGPGGAPASARPARTTVKTQNSPNSPRVVVTAKKVGATQTVNTAVVRTAKPQESYQTKVRLSKRAWRI